jgi:O-antigen ligase
MTPESRRTLLRHALAIDLMIVAAGVGSLFPESPAMLFGTFLVAIALSSILHEEVGVAATAYAVAVLALFFGERVDVASLTAFAATGAVLATIARVAQGARSRIHGAGRRAQGAEAPAPRALSPAPPFLYTFGLPLLIVVMYTDVSDILMRKAPVPSLLQPLILLMTFVVIRARRTLHPLGAAVRPVVLTFALYGLVVFATSIWARDAGLVDDDLSEIVKALFICILTASLASSWSALKAAFTALIASAAVLSAISVVQIATGRFLDAFGGLVTPQTGTIYEHILMPRASGPPNSDPNFYARILLIVIPLAIALALVERTRTRRIVYAAAAAMILAGTLVTYSRGAMLAVGAMAALLLIGFKVRLSRIALAGAAALALLLLLPNNVTRRFLTIETLMPDYETTSNDYDSSVEKRKVLVRAGLAMFDAHPFVGVGAGHYGRYYTRFANEVGATWIDYHPPGTVEYPHGLYFELASETGILGLAAFGATIVALLLSLERSRREALARGNRDLAIVALTLIAAVAGYLVASVFLHETHLRYLALYFGFSIAVARLNEVRA